MSVVSPQEVASYLRHRGVSPIHTAAMLANIQGESSFDPTILGDKGASLGLFQFQGPRRKALEARRNPLDWRTQIDHALDEPEGRRFISTQFETPEQATDWFVRYFERPKHPDRDVARRIGFLPKMNRYAGVDGSEFEPRQPVDQQAMASAPAQMQQQQLPTAGSMNPAAFAGMDPAMMAALGIMPQVQQSQPQPQQMGTSMDPMLTLGAGILANPEGGNGNPMSSLGKGVLAMGQAMQQSQMLEAEMNRSRAASMPKLPDNIREVIMLKHMYPDLTDAEALSMAFTGTVPPGGTQVKAVGDRIYEVRYDERGRPTTTPLSQDDQQGYEQVISDQARAGKVGAAFGDLQVKTIADVSGQLGKTKDSMIATDRLLKEFESGKFKGDVGAITGRIKQFFDPQTAELMSQEMTQVLQNLQITNLAPVSNYEIDLMRKMWASPFMNEEQNIAVLRKVKEIQTAKAAALRRTMDRLKREPIEEYLLDPESVEYYDFEDVGPPSPGPMASPGSPPASGGGPSMGSALPQQVGPGAAPGPSPQEMDEYTRLKQELGL